MIHLCMYVYADTLDCFASDVSVYIYKLRSGGRAVERRSVNRGDGGSIPPTAVSKLRQFRSPHIACVFRKRH